MANMMLMNCAHAIARIIFLNSIVEKSISITENTLISDDGSLAILGSQGTSPKLISILSINENSWSLDKEIEAVDDQLYYPTSLSLI